MPNLDALLGPVGPRDAPVVHPAGHLGRLDDHDDRLRPGPARRLRPPLLRRRRRPAQGQPRPAGPRPDLLAPALRLGPVGRQPEPAGDLSARWPSGGSSSRGWTPPTSTPRSRAPPPSPSGSGPRSPATTSGPLWKRPPRDLAEMAENARQTVDVFEAEAEAGRAGRPDGPRLVGPPGPVPEPRPVPAPGLALPERRRDRDRRPGHSTPPPSSVMAGLDRAIGRLCELADRRGAGVMVVSDHGFGPCLGRVHANRILIDAGVARMPGRRRAGSAGGPPRPPTTSGSGGPSATTPRPARPRSTSRSPPSSPSTGSGPWPSPRTRTRRRWST